jgi:hypothetical protein
MQGCGLPKYLIRPWNKLVARLRLGNTCPEGQIDGGSRGE